jgi:peroxiredoxin Q/BCP
MKMTWTLAVFLSAAVVAMAESNPPLEVGRPAPDFEALSTGGGKAKLSDYAGKWLVLYFYPKSFTPGCTREACSLRDGFEGLEKLDAVVLGVSSDDLETQTKFKAEHKLPFELLADTDKNTAKAYGSAGVMGLFKRQTFIVDPEGKLARVIGSVDVNHHAQQVADALRTLKEERAQ